MRPIDADEYRKCLIDHMTVPWERAKYDISDDYNKGLYDAARLLNTEPTIQPEPHEIRYDDCANALLKMWMDNVLTDGDYYRIADKLNKKWGKTELPEPYAEPYKGVTE